MAHNSYIRPGNVWSDASVLLGSEIAALALQAYKSINGDDGGTWAPSAPIYIGGSGFGVGTVPWALGYATVPVSGGYIGGAVAVDSGSAWAFTSGARLTGTITWGTATPVAAQWGGNATWASGATQIVGSGATLNIANGATFSTGASATVTHNGPVGCNGALVVVGATTLGAATINGTTTLAGATTQSGACTRTGALTLSGSGATTGWRRIEGTNADATYTVADGDEIDGRLCGSCTWTLSSSGATNGNRIRFVGGIGTVHVVPDAGPSSFIASGVSNTWEFVEYTYSSAYGGWRRSGGYKTP